MSGGGPLSTLQLTAIADIIALHATASDAARIAEVCKTVIDNAEAKRKQELYAYAASLMPGLRSICRTCDFGYDAVDYYFGTHGIWTWYAGEQEPRLVSTHAADRRQERPPHLTSESHLKIMEFVKSQ